MSLSHFGDIAMSHIDLTKVVCVAENEKAIRDQSGIDRLEYPRQVPVIAGSRLRPSRVDTEVM